MAENLEIPGRYSVRAPMQWSSDRHGGFSVVDDAGALCRPVVDAEGWSPDAGQRGRAAPRRTAPCSTGWSADPPPTRVSRSSAGVAARCSTPAIPPCSPTAPTGTSSTILAVHSFADERLRGTTATRARDRRRSSTCSRDAHFVPDAGRDGDDPAGPLRLRLVPPTPRRTARRAVTVSVMGAGQARGACRGAHLGTAVWLPTRSAGCASSLREDGTDAACTRWNGLRVDRDPRDHPVGRADLLLRSPRLARGPVGPSAAGRDRGCEAEPGKLWLAHAESAAAQCTSTAAVLPRRART